KELSEDNDTSCLYNFFRATIFEKKANYLEAARCYRKAIDLYDDSSDEIDLDFYNTLSKLDLKLHLWSGFVQLEEKMNQKIEEISNNVRKHLNLSVVEKEEVSHKIIT